MRYRRLLFVSYCDIVNILITGQVLHNTFVTDEECSCDVQMVAKIFTLLLKQGFASPTVEFSHWPQQFYGNTCTALLNKNR